MRSRRRLAAAGAGLLGSALLAATALAPSAGAKPGGLTIYSANAVARGLEATAAVRPHTLDPLGQVAAPFVRTELNTIPQSDATASVLYPGDLPQAVLDEEGPVDSGFREGGFPVPVFYPLTLKGSYPDKPDREKTVAGFADQGGLSAQSGYLRALAKLEENRSQATVERLVLRSGGEAPVVAVDGVQATSDAFTKDGRITQVAAVRAEGIELLGGMIRVASLFSLARAVSDGNTVVEREAKLVLGGVEVVESGGRAHRATIDHHGIHIDDPDRSEDVNQGLTAALQYALGRAGISVSTIGTTTTAEGPTGQAFAGGLLVSFRTGGCEPCPTLLRLVPRGVVPEQVFDVINTVATRCELGPGGENILPVCFTPGLVPSASNSLDATLAIGGAAVAVSGGIEQPFEIPTDTGFAGGFTGGSTGPAPTGVLGGQFTQGPLVTDGGLPAVQAPAVTAPPPVLTGLQARMPSGALAGVGAALLLLALGLVLAPSFRP